MARISCISRICRPLFFFHEMKDARFARHELQRLDPVGRLVETQRTDGNQMKRIGLDFVQRGNPNRRSWSPKLQKKHLTNSGRKIQVVLKQKKEL